MTRTTFFQKMNFIFHLAICLSLTACFTQRKRELGKGEGENTTTASTDPNVDKLRSLGGGGEQLSVRSHLTLGRSLISMAGIKNPSANLMSQLKAQQTALPAKGQSGEMNSPASMAALKSSALVCNEFERQEGTSTAASILGGLNYNDNSPISMDMVRELSRRMILQFYSRPATESELNTIVEELTTGLEGSSPSTASEKALVVKFICIVLLASVDAQKV